MTDYTLLTSGSFRTLLDMAFNLFKSSSYNKNLIIKTDLVRIANQRFSDLPAIFSLNVAPFRSNENEVHAGMAGKHRRQISPFLWVCLMGLQPYTSADNDLILQAALCLNEIQIQLRRD